MSDIVRRDEPADLKLDIRTAVKPPTVVERKPSLPVVASAIDELQRIAYDIRCCCNVCHDPMDGCPRCRGTRQSIQLVVARLRKEMYGK